MANKHIVGISFIRSTLLCSSLLLLSACGTTSTSGLADTPPPYADQLQITVTLQPAQHVVFTYSTLQAAIIATVQNNLLTIPFSPPGAVYSCPSYTSPTFDSYDVRFLARGNIVEHATSDALDCNFWHISTSRGEVNRISPPKSFWDSLHQETGTPLPVNDYP